MHDRGVDDAEPRDAGHLHSGDRHSAGSVMRDRHADIKVKRVCVGRSRPRGIPCAEITAAPWQSRVTSLNARGPSRSGWSGKGHVASQPAVTGRTSCFGG